MKFRLTLAIFTLAGLALPAAISGQNGQFSDKITSAPAPNVTPEIEPSDGNAVLYSPLAAHHSGGEVEAMVALSLKISNQEATAVKLTKVQISFTGQPKVADVIYDTDFSVNPKTTRTLHFDRTKNIILPFPPPQGIKIGLTFNGFSVVTISKPLAPHVNPVAGGSYLFPAKTSHLTPGEFWSGGSGHPGSDQRFGYDMGVAGWDPSISQWTGQYPGKSSGKKNTDYRVWDKPIYAMADGRVIYCKMNEPDNPAPGQEITSGGGNSFLIQHGPDEQALYAHMRKINANLCHAGKMVKAGEMLGRAGNSGSTGGIPHLHIHVTTMKNEFRPLLFRNMILAERAKVVPGELTAPWVYVKGKALPNALPEGPNLPKRTSLIWPATTKPKPNCAGLSLSIQETNADIDDLQKQLQDAGPSQKGPLGNLLKAAKAKLAALKAEADKLGCPPMA
jgi:hypothetical protein